VRFNHLVSLFVLRNKNITFGLVSSEQLDGGMKKKLMCNVF